MEIKAILSRRESLTRQFKRELITSNNAIELSTFLTILECNKINTKDAVFLSILNVISIQSEYHNSDLFFPQSSLRSQAAIQQTP